MTPEAQARQHIYDAGVTTRRVAGEYEVPAGLLWGILWSVPPTPGETLEQTAQRIAKRMHDVHFTTGKWDTAVWKASGGKVTDVQATRVNSRLNVLKSSGWENVRETPDLLIAAGALALGGAAAAGAGAIGLGGAAAADTLAAGGAEAGALGAGAGAAEAGAAGGAAGSAEKNAAGAAGGSAAGSAASKLAGALSSSELAGGLVAGIAAIVSGYGVRLLEVLAGLGLVLFGLVTVANGGRTPSIPRPA